MARVAFAPDNVKLRCAQLLRFAPALRVTFSSAAAGCAYAESGAFGAGDDATIIEATSTRVRVDAPLSTRPRNRGRPSPLHGSSLVGENAQGAGGIAPRRR
jgi:hypothetical protein